MLFLRWLLPFRTQQAAEEGPVLQLTSQNDAEAAEEGFLLWSIIPAAPYARIRELSEETFSDPGGLSRSFQSLRRLANIKVGIYSPNDCILMLCRLSGSAILPIARTVIGWACGKTAKFRGYQSCHTLNVFLSLAIKCNDTNLWGAAPSIITPLVSWTQQEGQMQA